MRKIGLFLFGSGLIGFLIGGAGIDGWSGPAANVILTVVSFIVAAVGYRLWEISERKEAHEKAQAERRRKEFEATEKAIARSKEATFQVWIESGKLDVSV